MASPPPAAHVNPGGFEQSFMFHMIRDFFLLLLVVAAVELAIRYLALRYDFSRAEGSRVERAAEQLANDIRSIMLNSGGPNAAQTVYPILNRNYDDLGLSIAVLPAPVTVESMRATRNMEAQGLPARWAVGEHQQASVALKAEQFCLGCHVKAQVGDVLGTVAVRSYLARKEALWWQEVRLTAGSLSLKILVHTFLLFGLLKVRMAPLLALRATVSQLARGVMDLSPRAAVRTDDEFGELASDLNHFLDRISQIVNELDRILGEVLAVGERLGALNRHLERQLDGLRDASLRNIGEGAQRGLDIQLVAAREAGAFGALVQTLDALADNGAMYGQAGPALREQLLRLRESFGAVAQALQAMAPPVTVTEAQAAEYRDFAQCLRDMALLEASMQSVGQSGRQMLQRLTAGKGGVGHPGTNAG
jgi:HAMP domain-containing protein